MLESEFMVSNTGVFTACKARNVVCRTSVMITITITIAVAVAVTITFALTAAITHCSGTWRLGSATGGWSTS